MHHAVLDQWSRGASTLHRRDPRAKFAALLVFLLAINTAHRSLPVLGGALLLLLAATLVWARIPLGGALLRAAVVLPFTLVFAAWCWLAGDPARGLAMLLKTYLSALAVLTVMATTPLPMLLRGIELSGAPRLVLLVAQFLYRYLFVISEEAQHMRKAAASRGGGRRARFRAAGGALAVLFARSYARAGEIQRAMAARGFEGRFPTLGQPRFAIGDGLFLALAALAPVVLRVWIERIA